MEPSVVQIDGGPGRGVGVPFQGVLFRAREGTPLPLGPRALQPCQPSPLHGCQQQGWAWQAGRQTLPSLSCNYVTYNMG